MSIVNVNFNLQKTFKKKVAIIYKYLYIINNKINNKDLSGGHN